MEISVIMIPISDIILMLTVRLATSLPSKSQVTEDYSYVNIQSKSESARMAILSLTFKFRTIVVEQKLLEYIHIHDLWDIHSPSHPTTSLSRLHPGNLDICLMLLPNMRSSLAFLPLLPALIQYNGPWFSDIGNWDTQGEFGPPFRSTLHGSYANASLQFTYHGTEVGVYGSIEFPDDPNIVECFIDGIQIGLGTPYFHPANNQLLCSEDTISDGLHTVVVNATVMINRTFWFDEIRYIPSASAPLDQEIILVDNADPQLQYGNGWQGSSTNTNESIFTFDFIGVSIVWYGTIVGWGGYSLSATYSIDGQPPIHFDTLGRDRGRYEILFETAQLPASPHALKVVYQGNNDSEPLNLQYLAIQNGTLSSTVTSVSSHTPSTTTTSTTTSNGTSGTSTPGKSSTPVGAIIGGVIGGLTLIVFTILGLLLLRRRKRRAVEEKVLSSTPRPFNFEYATLPPSSTTPNYSLPLQQSTTLTIGGPLLPPLPVSCPSPLPLLSKTERNAELLAVSESQRRGNTVPAMVSMQSNDTRLPNVVAQEDSSIRMPTSTPVTSVIMEAPPLYTVE